MALWGKTDTTEAKPKYLSDELRNEQEVSDLDSTVGVSVTEAQSEDNRAKGVKAPGWTITRTYVDAQGTTRNKTEILVAMNEFAVDGSDNDTLVPEITITAQPTAQIVLEGETATFSVTAAGGTLGYQWERSDDAGTTWSSIIGATEATYTTDALTSADDDGDEYRVVISLAGADSVTSSAAVLTVTAA